MKTNASTEALITNRDLFKSVKEKVYDTIKVRPMINTSVLKDVLRLKHQTLTARLSDLQDEGRINDMGTDGKYSMWAIVPADFVESYKQGRKLKKFQQWLNKGIKDYDLTSETMNEFLEIYKKNNL